ncbi:MAG: hypothetical protein GX619_03845 [Bacteroidales bacterium]|nr:hypothetical protein [Bacteroidales bacterium]
MPGVTRRIVRPARFGATHGLTGVTSPLSHILRLRRRKGHGIHSPYLYHLLTDVLFNKHSYYCFDALMRHHPADKQAHRFGRLLFRLTMDVGANHSLYAGSKGTPDLAYLATAGTKHRVDVLAYDEDGLARTHILAAGLHTDNLCIYPILRYESLQQQIPQMKSLDLVVINPHPDNAFLMAVMKACLERCHHGSVLVVNRPFDKDVAACWAFACQHPSVTASLEAYRFGILLFRPDLEKKTYHL